MIALRSLLKSEFFTYFIFIRLSLKQGAHYTFLWNRMMVSGLKITSVNLLKVFYLYVFILMHEAQMLQLTIPSYLTKLPYFCVLNFWNFEIYSNFCSTLCKEHFQLIVLYDFWSVTPDMLRRGRKACVVWTSRRKTIWAFVAPLILIL